MRNLKELRKALGGTALLSLAALATAATSDIQAKDAYVSDGNGVPREARVGESFYVTTRFRVSGSLNSTYKVRVETPFGKSDSARFNFAMGTGDYWVCWGPFSVLMDGDFQVKTQLDPERKVRESNRNNNFAAVNVHPVSPASALEYFAPKTLSGQMGLDVQWNRRSAIPTSVVAWIPAPSSETFQQSATPSIDATFQALVADPYGQTIFSKTVAPSNLDPMRFEASFRTRASGARINRSMLDQAAGILSADVQVWLQKEELVELGKSDFRNWVNRVAPAATRGGMSTADLAESLYRSVLKNCSYEFKAGTAPSAYQTLRKKKGDCGGLSSLFVALCRTAGIPARTVAGFAEGSNNWHVWAEFYVGGAGWIPVDPAYAEGKLAKGSDTPIYFGVIPELNGRIATAYGLDRQIGDFDLPMLQSPAVFWYGRNVKVQKLTAFSKLDVVG